MTPKTFARLLVAAIAVIALAVLFAPRPERATRSGPGAASPPVVPELAVPSAAGDLRVVVSIGVRDTEPIRSVVDARLYTPSGASVPSRTGLSPHNYRPAERPNEAIEFALTRPFMPAYLLAVTTSRRQTVLINTSATHQSRATFTGAGGATFDSHTEGATIAAGERACFYVIPAAAGGGAEVRKYLHGRSCDDRLNAWFAGQTDTDYKESDPFTGRRDPAGSGLDPVFRPD